MHVVAVVARLRLVGIRCMGHIFPSLHKQA